MKKMLFVLHFAISSTLNADNIDLNDGDIHINDWSGTFASKLDGHYSIVVQTDYDNRSMTAVVIDIETGEIHCLLQPCNYNQ